MLNVSHLSAEYQGRLALRDVSFQIAAGQLVVVLGPSGCGKTTLLNLIAGFIEPSAGSITLDGTSVHGPSAERGVVFQHEGLLPWRNVVDNVEFGLQLAGVGKAQRRQVAEQMLQRVGLAGYERHFIWQLSGGMRQRVGIARALAADPPIVLLDEPFGALDPVTRREMQAEFKTLQRRLRKTMVFVTHDIGEAFALATRVTEFTPPGLDRVFFANSGSEAVDTALKIALKLGAWKIDQPTPRIMSGIITSV